MNQYEYQSVLMIAYCKGIEAFVHISILYSRYGMISLLVEIKSLTTDNLSVQLYHVHIDQALHSHTTQANAFIQL